MSSAAPAASPLWDVREVVETYRRYRIVRSDWAAILISALEDLETSSSSQHLGPQLDDVMSELREIISTGLEDSSDLVERLADVTQALIQQIRMPGIPTPQDADWAFPDPNAS